MGSGLRGSLDPSDRRYIKWAWNSATYTPPLGQVDHIPKASGLFSMFGAGSFHAGTIERFPWQKSKISLSPLGFCAYCGSSGANIKLTSEHVIPEFLGAGLEIPKSSCEICQNVTSEFESTIATEIFDPVRKNLGVEGKRGVIKTAQFPLDIGREIMNKVYVPIAEHPTIIVLPYLFPASAYSGRPVDTDGIFNLRVYNLNADIAKLANIGVDGFSTVSIDTVRFCQLIAKIGHVYAVSKQIISSITGVNGAFISKSIPAKTPYVSHFNTVGCLWDYEEQKSSSLHEIELGNIEWNGSNIPAVRVRLFASFDMPSYFVAL